MTQPADLHVVTVPQLYTRLGRQVVHDPRSRGFALAPALPPIDRATWRSRSLRTYDPARNPDQPRGDCTGCSKAITFNTVGSRVAGRVLGLDTADAVYALATTLDPWPGSWSVDPKPHGTGEDTGSSGLAAAQAAQQLGLGGEYRWLFRGADEVVQTIVSLGHPVSVGTWWYEGGFQPKPEPGGGVRIEMTGRRVGGHQWTVLRYDAQRDLIGGRCWWGTALRDFWMRREHLQQLLADDGDAHVQVAA